MSIDLHHAHLFASDIEATIAWWTRHLGARVLRDEVLAGARNVFLAVGSGRIHVYDQPPRRTPAEAGTGRGGRGAIHHLGVKVTGLREVWARLQSEGIGSPGGLREHGDWRYVMIAAPDDVLLELFELDDWSRLG